MDFNIFGGDDDRPPAPEVATPADIERYNREWIKHHNVEADTDPAVDPVESFYAKDGGLSENVKSRAEFPWLYDPSRGVRWDFDPIALRNLAQGNTWVGMLVQSITKEVAETPYTIVAEDDRSETQKRLSTHPEEREPLDKADLPDSTAERIYDLLQTPNPDDNWQDLVEMWLGDELEIGSLAAVKAYPRSAYDGEEFIADPETVEPLAILPSAPEVWTKGYQGKTGLLDGYWQFDDHKSPGHGSTEGTNRRSRGINAPTFFDVDEMIWDDMTPRTNRAYGMPPTLLVEDFLQSLDLAVTQEQEYLGRGSIPSGAWVFDEYDRQEVKELQQEFNENVKGKPHKSLMFAGRGGDVKFEPMSMNFQELEFTERMRWYARVVASAFQVPTAVVGIEPEKVNYNTFQGERENFESNTLGPYLQRLERVINDQLIRPHWDGYRFEFKPGMSESTRGMISDRVRSEFDSNIRTRNEARRELGLETVDEEADGFKDDVVEGSESDLGEIGLSVTGDRVTKQETFDDYPDAAVANAQMALDAREDTGNPNDCGTDTGWARANQLANRESLSEDTVRRMAAFRRHQDNAEMDDDEGRADCGWLMWNAWGGEEGIAWAEGVVEDLDGEETESSVQKDDALRNTDEWYLFDVQPEMVESLQADIADDVRDIFDAVLTDDEVQRIIDRLAADETDKSASALARRLKELFEESDVVARIQRALSEGSAEAVREALENAVEATDETPDVDIEAIEEQLADRSVEFADEFADRMSEKIRETVGDGWAEGRNSREIAQDIAEQADIDAGWNGAERIARQELQIASGKAREEVAGQLDKVRVWDTAGDDRVRDAHAAMDGTWARPGEAFVVEYEDRGTQKESVPGDSEPGIGCRCVQLLRDRDEVDDANYAGDGSLN